MWIKDDLFRDGVETLKVCAAVLAKTMLDEHSLSEPERQAAKVLIQMCRTIGKANLSNLDPVCPVCSGSGSVWTETGEYKRYCSKCHGNGRVS